LNDVTKCNTNIGMNKMVKVNLPGKLMKIITFSEKYLVELFVTLRISI